ncbi:hypothetical protein SLE2022_009810 [Rubroshorea leprosula]
MTSRVTRSRRQPPQQQQQQQQEQEQEQQLRAKWTTSLTGILVDLLVGQVHKGNRLNNSFSKKAWKSICDAFNRKTHLKWDKEQLKNRFAVLRRQHALVKCLLDQKDFTWDESTGAIIANDEAWAEYIRGQPDAETIKSNGCPIYKQLCVIFSEPTTNGKCEQSAEPLNMIKLESSTESEEMDDVEKDPDAVPTSTPASNSNRKRGRKGIDDAIAAAILEMAAASKLRTAAVKQHNARYSIASCIRELDELQGVEERVYFAALELFNNPSAREMFLSLKRDKRLTWLCHKCVAPYNL